MIVVIVRRFNVSEFSNLKSAWQELLVSSDANRLFLSWYWMFSWWEKYSVADFELLLLGVYEGDKLLCIAPLYIHNVKVKSFFKSRRVEFIGTNSSGHSGFRSEYLQFISSEDREKESVKLIFSWLKENVKFNELYLNDLVKESVSYRYLSEYAQIEECYFRVTDAGVTYRISTEGDFDKYLQSIGKNSRLKLYNRRKILATLGEAKLEMVGFDSFEKVLDQLTSFHLARWEKTICYETHKLFVSSLCSGSDISVSGVMLFLDERLLGCTFDLDCSGVSYNFQLGFEDNIDKRISMGSLVLGYDIEHCFNSPEICYFDLLAGEGKNSNYKTRLAQPSVQFESVQVIKPSLLKWLFKVKDKCFQAD